MSDRIGRVLLQHEIREDHNILLYHLFLFSCYFSSFSSKNNMNYFNPQQYKGSRFQMNAFLHWLKKSNINMDRQITVLDAGCGDGSIAEYLLQNYPSLSLRGFDASEKQVSGAIQRCQRFQDRSKFLVGTFDSIPVTFKDDPADLVIASYSLHLAPSMERAIRNLADRVKPEVRLYSLL